MTADAEAARAEALDELGRSFKATMAAVRRLRGRETHSHAGLSYAQYSLLSDLGHEGELSAGELAVAADLSPATVTQMLASMAAAGLVERVRSEDDKRVVLTSLTKRGRDLLAERQERLRLLWREALDEFDDDALRAAGAVLDKLHALFDELAEYGEPVRPQAPSAAPTLTTT